MIKLPRRFQTIELKINKVLIEESTDCVKDSLTILNGKHENSLPIATYCGTKSPATMQSSTRVVIIKFVSDGSLNKNGFSLQYRGLTERMQGKQM